MFNRPFSRDFGDEEVERFPSGEDGNEDETLAFPGTSLDDLKMSFANLLTSLSRFEGYVTNEDALSWLCFIEYKFSSFFSFNLLNAIAAAVAADELPVSLK